ncbi:fibroblast growth factor-binding protein 1 [Rhinophrynus dorsalis]
MKLRHVTFFCVICLLVSQTYLVEGNKQKEGKKDREGTGNQKQRGEGKGEKKQIAANPNEKETKSKGGKGSLQGKFSTKDKANCVWSVTETGTVTLKINCTRGESVFSCTFGGNPSSCAKYAANQKSYWKQITRALRKQKNICQESKTVLKSKECKKGPEQAHLRYISSSFLLTNEDKGSNQAEAKPTVQVNLTDATKDCAGDSDEAERKRAAAEYCGESWSSFCTFFFSMVQSKSC